MRSGTITSAQNNPPADQVIPFRLLGPLEVVGPDAPVRVPPGRQQYVLAALLLELNRVVSTDYLVDVLWEHDPPETARTQVQICVSRLRRLLRPTGATIHTRPPGYQLAAPEESVDVQVHRARVREAAALAQQGRDEEVAALLRSAVGLWRGPALSGVETEALRTKATRMDEERLTAVESYLDIELRLGRHTQLVGEIGALVEEHPFRERLRAQLMLALYRSGRQAEALDVYRTGRDLLVDELGLDPGEELRHLEEAILAGSPDLMPPVAAPVAVTTGAAEPTRTAPGPTAVPPAPEPPPAAASAPGPGTPAPPQVTPYQLPTVTADFVGRSDVVGGIERALLNDTDTAVGAVVLVGRPGVGKSATAVRVAHTLGPEHFPDGQLYCDLRGTREPPLEPSDVLGRFLRALGVHGQAIPDDVDERASMYRGILATRRVLVVLDDAANEGQVTSLIPGGAGCGVIVTSRHRLTGLPGARLIEMDVLSGDQCLELLGQVLGPERVSAEPEAALALVRAVGRLPLALRIVAARLAARPHWPLSGMVDRLADERRRLDELAHGDMTVRASLSLTRDGLEPRTARVFSLLGLVEGPTIPVWAAGALMDDDGAFPSDLTEPLGDAHMLDVVGVDPAGEPVYRFHDLVRDYAREQLTRDEAAGERTRAVARLLGGWLSLLDTANRRLLGGDHLQIRGDAPRWAPPRRYVDRLLADPYAWLEAERANLRHAVAQAVEADLAGYGWELVVGFSVFLTRRGYLDDLAEAHDRVAPLLAERGERLGTAALMETVVHSLGHRYDDAAKRAMLQRVLAEFTDLGETRGRLLALRHLAHMDLRDGDLESAFRRCEEALAGFVGIGDIGGQWKCLMLLGNLRIHQGDLGRGWADLDRALGLAERTGDERARAQVLRRMGQAALRNGEEKRALGHLVTALELVERLNDPVGEAMVLQDLGSVHLAMGEVVPARTVLERAMAVYEQLRDEDERAGIARVLAGLG